MTKTILYIGWVGFGNQGDDLCYDIFVQEMSRRAAQHSIKLDIKGLFPANFTEFSLARLAPDLVVLGAGSLFEPVYLKPLVLAQQESIPTAIWGSGYDSMLPSPIQANLIDPDSAFMIRSVVQNATLLGVRGPYTMEMLDAIGARSIHLDVVGDPGLFLEQGGATCTLPELGDATHPIIAVNWGTASNNVLGGNEKAVALDLRDALLPLMKDHRIVIYAVWSKDLVACKNLYSLIDHPNCILLERVPTMEELIALYQQCVLSVNMKLHANVFSAAMDCPFVCLAYRMKNYDFAQSLDWTDFTVFFSDHDRKERIRTAIETLLKTTASHARRLREKKEPYVAKLSTLNDAIVSLLNN
jgi:polysaccharide pyruvyl transferase WcaK-like protein